MIVQALRSALFYLLFLGQTVILAVLIGTIAVIARGPTRPTWALVRYWCWSNVWLLKIVAGIGTEVAGAGNIPEGGCIIAAKHQSDWDVFAIFPHTGRPAYIVKKELMSIPFFGWAARAFDCIEVDRKKGSEAIPDMMAQARRAVARGRRIVIFPEGTRKAPLAPPDYRSGIVRMYLELGVPVVPVALNSGLYWGRNSLILWPGTARATILPPIAPGLEGDVFLQTLRDAIETESDCLILQAADAGLTRPIDPELAARLAQLRAAQSPDR